MALASRSLASDTSSAPCAGSSSQPGAFHLPLPFFRQRRVTPALESVLCIEFGLSVTDQDQPFVSRCDLRRFFSACFHASSFSFRHILPKGQSAQRGLRAVQKYRPKKIIS